MCVTLYLIVLAFEIAADFRPHGLDAARFAARRPVVWQSPSHAPYLAVAGLGLSMLHQSSLGASYGVLKARPIWYRPDLSVLFMLSQPWPAESH